MSTYTALYYHLIFSTKHRIPHIHKSWRKDLHSYVAGTIQGLGGFIIQVGGVDDHIHILVGLTSSHTLKNFVRELKTSTSKWVHKSVGSRAFQWQDGYAAFTVSPPACGSVQHYIEKQEEHHKTLTFKEELVAFLEKAGIEYDPKYLK